MAVTGYAFDPDMSEAFAVFRHGLYRGDANWIAPLKSEVRARFAPDFGFYRRPGNRHRHFIATAGGAVVGHVSATINRDLEDPDGDPVGAVGFFESVENFEIAADLLDAATRWLNREAELTRVWGPLDFDIWHGYRLMTRGFDEATFFGEPYNKPYYPDFFEKFGFRRKQRWNSTVITGREALESSVARFRENYRQTVARGYRFVAIDLGRSSHLRRLHALITGSYRRFLGYTPISADDFRRLYAARARLLDRRLMSWICDETGTPVGFSLAYADYSDALRAMRGKDGPAARLRFLRRRRAAHRAVYYLIGLAPEAAGRTRGLGRAASYHTVHAILRGGYDEVVAALIARGNPARGLVPGGTRQAHKEYALYELVL